MGNPVIQSSLLASTHPDLYLPMDVEEYDDDMIAKLRRDDRKFEARDFRSEYVYGRSMDKKTCIWPGGDYSWLDDSSGITWVGVYGNDSICVVTEAEDLDVTRVHGWLIFLTKEKVLCNFRRTVISEIEDIADPFSILHESLAQSIKKPFAVVSVEGGHERGHESSSVEYKEDKIFKLFLEELNRQALSDEYESDEDDKDSRIKFIVKRDIEELAPSDEYESESSDEDDEDSGIKFIVKRNVKALRTVPAVPGYDEKKTIKYIQEEMKKDAAMTINETVQETSDKYDEKKAIKFLQEKMKTVDDFSSEETIQIAVSAFQHLLKKKFKADDVGVSVLDPKDPDYDKIYIKELDKRDREHHLAEINAPGSGGSSSGGSTITCEGSD